MSFTAKSVIFDFADNHGHATLSGIRSIEFFYEGSRLDLESSDFTVYAVAGQAQNEGWRALDTTLSQTGTYVYTSFLSADDGAVRMSVVFNSSQTFDSIVINNFHHSGTLTEIGYNNVVINISTDTITSTVYEAAITNATEIYDGVFAEHSASDAVDDDELSLLSDVPEVTTDAASGLGLDFVTLNGELTSMAGEASLDVSFEYGETTGYGSETTPETLTSTGTFDADLTGLDDDTTYHYRAVVTDGSSDWYGDDESFTTKDYGVASTFPSLTLEMVEFTYPDGDLEATFPSMSLDMLQTEGFTNPTGVASAELPSIELSLVGGASISAQFPSLQANAAGVSGHAGSIAASFPKFSLHAYAGSRIYTSLPALSLDMTAISNTIADISAQMPVLGCSIVASIASEGDIDVLFPKLTAAMEATAGIVGTISGTLPKFYMAATATPGTVGDLEGAFRLPRLNATGGPSGPAEISASFPMFGIELTSGEISSDVLRYDWGRIT